MPTSNRFWGACAKAAPRSTKCNYNKPIWKISSCRSWIKVSYECAFHRFSYPRLQRDLALLEGGDADGGRAGTDGHAVSADFRPRPRWPGASLYRGALYRLPDPRPGDDER